MPRESRIMNESVVTNSNTKALIHEGSKFSSNEGVQRVTLRVKGSKGQVLRVKVG